MTGELSGDGNVRWKYPMGMSGLRIPLQDYKSLRVPVVIYVTLVNTHTDRQTEKERESFTHTNSDVRTVERPITVSH